MQTSIISINHLVSEAQCYETIRRLRWQEGVACPHCDSAETIRRGFDGPERHLRRLSTWVLCLYFMGLNLSNAQAMTECLRDGIAPKKSR